MNPATILSYLPQFFIFCSLLLVSVALVLSVLSAPPSKQKPLKPVLTTHASPSKLPRSMGVKFKDSVNYSLTERNTDTPVKTPQNIHKPTTVSTRSSINGSTT